MAIRVRDTFTDVAGKDLIDHVGEVGATWVRRSGNAAALVFTDANRVRANAASAAAFYFPSGQLGDEQDISGDLHFHSDNDEIASVAGRSSGPDAGVTSANYYRGSYSNQGTGVSLRLQKVIAGTLTTLQSKALNLGTANTSYRMRLEIRAAMKKVFIDEVEHLSVSDDTVPLSPHCGLHFQTFSPSVPGNTTGIHIDYFEASDTTTTSQTHPLSGTISGGSAVSASTLTVSHALAGQIAGGSSAAASGLSISHPLAGSITGGSSVTAPGLILSHPLSGSVSGSSAAGADRLTVSHALSGTLTGSSELRATSLAMSHPLVGELHGSSAVSGILSKKEFRTIRHRSYLVGL